MAKDLTAARCYARAYFQAASAEKNEEKACRDMGQFVRLVDKDEKLARTLDHPFLPAAEKKKAVLSKMKSASPVFGRFLELLIVKKRVSFAARVAELLEEMLDEARGVQRMRVKSAAPLAAEQAAALEKEFGKLWNKQAKAELFVDESLVAGLLVQAGDRVWDASLKGRLERLRERMLQSARN
ncbi:MAG TPA: ATP synthase F1 subunit delta [Elusimicrobiota bacterium]|nr:ATP synthase F1 subunit delta [Elusimicrobiota bacterium]